MEEIWYTAHDAAGSRPWKDGDERAPPRQFVGGQRKQPLRMYGDPTTTFNECIRPYDNEFGTSQRLGRFQSERLENCLW